jgi:aspartyl-tRNA(Asn)/glutamyl-tRNA(Gln) amidotransferase subunit A
VGTDIGGSIRLPGTWLGLTTLKPSAGRVPLDAPYLGRVAGPITRSARDAALLLTVISRPDPRDWTSLPPLDLAGPLSDLSLDVHGLRVGLLLDAGAGLPLEDEIRRAVTAAGSVFADAGAKVEPLDSFVTDAMLTGLDEFWRVRSLVDFLALPDDRRQRVLPFIQRWVQRAADVSGTALMRDYAGIAALQQATAVATERFDLVLSPVAPVSAFPAEWPMPWGPDTDLGMAHIAYTAPYNMTGQPAATTNCGFTADGRTIGLQIAGRRFDDVGVLRAAHWFEEHAEPALRPRWPLLPL